MDTFVEDFWGRRWILAHDSCEREIGAGELGASGKFVGGGEAVGNTSVCAFSLLSRLFIALKILRKEY